METIETKNIQNTALYMAVNAEKETEKAVYVWVCSQYGYNAKFWIPKSLICETESEFIIPMWFVNKNFAKIN